MPVLDLSEYRLNDVGDGYSTLAGLKTLVDIASKVPRSAIESSWEILARNLITAAKARGFKASVAGSELKQAVDYLAFRVFNSTQIHAAVYGLGAVLQKVHDQDPAVSLRQKVSCLLVQQ